ncbi:MAG TPA: RNA-directed DNA polymerase [candidate division WWE3 bacterium]|uniref:RNA-directed DNA polymerase n=1 Tax=candidate division WWE3 bacterium TaxID=2053526 RepID=A0A7C1HYU6_UNCKA|nr:RNA-directed DNA polymerase [candidate division WWE3 bacterium]
MEGILGEEAFFIKADIKKYFSSIDHACLKKMLQKLIPSRAVLVLLFKIIDFYEEAPGKGLPLGNVTSQLFANLYLAYLDDFLLSELKAIYGESVLPCNLVFRYMDAFVVLVKKEDLLLIRGKF